MRTVFVSYAREDRDVAIQMIRALSDAGFAVWYDGNLPGGDNFGARINTSIEEADAVVVIWSRHAVSSQFVYAEAMRGFDRGVLLPVTISPQTPQPVPFNAVQTYDLGNLRFDSSSGEWSSLITALRAKSALAAPAGGVSDISKVTRTWTSLVGYLRDAKADGERIVRSKVDAICAIAAKLELFTIVEDLEIEKRRFQSNEFRVAVVGRMKTGKSTFLNALLGNATNTGEHGPLPTDDLPCTAVLSIIRFGVQPKVKALYFNGVEDDMSFADYARMSTIYSDDAKDPASNTNLLSQVDTFDIEWPSELLHAGVQLIDSPGISEDPRRTERTRAAIRNADAAIFMLRHDVLAGQDEVEFAEYEVAPATGKVFTVINLWNDRRVDDKLRNVAAQRLKLHDGGGGGSEREVFFVNVLSGGAAKARADLAALEQTGLGALEKRLGTFLVDERHAALVMKSLRQCALRGAELLVRITERKTALVADQGKLRTALELCEKDIEAIRRRKRSIEETLDLSEQQAGGEAVRSFKLALAQAERVLMEKLDRRALDSNWLKKLMKSGTEGQVLTEFLRESLQEHLREWAEATPDRPGLARDLAPTLDLLQRSIEREVTEIQESLKNIRVHLSELKSSASTEVAVLGAGEQMVSAVASTILFGPLGAPIGAGGFRGLAGAAVSGLGTAFIIGAVAAMLAAPISLPLVAIASLFAGFAGGAAASAMGLDSRIKRKAWEAFEPVLRRMGEDEKALGEIRAGVTGWYQEIREGLRDGLSTLLRSEEEALTKLKDVNHNRARAGEELQRLDMLEAELLALVAELPQPERVGAV